MLQSAALIGIDWGTSSFRAVLMDAKGAELDRCQSADGILAVPGRDFDAFFESRLGSWLSAHPDLPVIASGMITSRQGWIETPYLPLPLTSAALAGALTTHVTQQGRTVHFVTGALCDTDPGFPDVMRGEETELVGHAMGGEDTNGLFVMPGTHSKWALLRDGALVDFETCMTGEIFAVLQRHSILAQLAENGIPDDTAFRRGVTAAQTRPGSLLGRLFSARTLPLLGRIEVGTTLDYLSGLLIGDEFAGQLSRRPGTEGGVTIIGRGDLSERYRIAAETFGITASIAAPGAARLGQLAIARQAGLLT